MKPILFNSEMVRAIFEGKTQTRRVIKPQPPSSADKMIILGIDEKEPDFKSKTRITTAGEGGDVEIPYQIDDVIYVRETWAPCATIDSWIDNENKYLYKADFLEKVDWKWRPSIHMSRESARVFLKVNNVRGEQLQDITEEDAVAEGCCSLDAFVELWDFINAEPKPQYKTVDGKKVIDHYVSYPWVDIQEIMGYKGKLLYVYGNPWVWVIEFEKINDNKI